MPNVLLEINEEKTPETMKRQNQSKRNTQLWMWLVMEEKFDAVKNTIAQEPGMLGPRIKVNWKWLNRRWWMNTDILGISELKQTGIGELNLGDH